MHGKLSYITHSHDGMFNGIDEKFVVTRYHSLLADEDHMPDCLKITATTADGKIMGLQHHTRPVFGVQFHPESIASAGGYRLLRAFLSLTGQNKLPDEAEMKRLEGQLLALIKNSRIRFMSEILHEITKQIIEGAELPEAVMRTAFEEIMEGHASPVELASFLIGLRMRGETPDDIAAGAGILRNKALSITAPDTAMDIVGTGGDKIGTYNISTATAMVVAGTGVPVAKHGNKAVSSKSGAADVLTTLGINMDCPFDALEDALTQAGVVFLMAPSPPCGHAACRAYSRRTWRADNL